MQILEALGNPIISTSLPGEFVEDYTDPEIIQQNIGNKVDLIVDGGIGGTEPSTIVDCSTDDWQVVRQGLGQFEA
jgi:tRNA A37 threonylcarbamoyladenosine synthetase subunit TsaC/SUA5/YrdC